MSERFLRYDPSELRAAGERFVEALATSRRALAAASDPEVWTEVTLDWMAARAAAHARVDASCARPHLTAEIYRDGELGPPRAVVRQGPVAMLHTTHVAGDPYGYAYWDRAFERERLETLLALACEWGGGGRRAARFGRVLLAASELAGLDARAKAIVFASDDEEEHRRVVAALAKLRLASWDARPWLWIDVPWRADWNVHPPRSGLLEG